jgi:hypothetical protein
MPYFPLLAKTFQLHHNYWGICVSSISHLPGKNVLCSEFDLWKILMHTLQKWCMMNMYHHKLEWACLWLNPRLIATNIDVIQCKSFGFVAIYNKGQ